MTTRALLLAALLAAACHPKGVATPASGASSGGAAAAGKKPDDEKPKKRRTGSAATPVPVSPSAALEPGQIRRIQQALAGRKLLEGSPSGSLDEPTRGALRRFQHDQDLPETGLPDHETVRKLGLDPDEVFAKRRDVAGP